MMTANLYLKNINIEMILWPLALIFLATLDPHVEHWSLCPIKNLGVEFCPGCGLGRSITLLFQGEFRESFHAHPLGGFAIIALGYRSLYLGLTYKKEVLDKRHKI